MKNAKVLQNTFMLYVVSITKMVLPLLTLPYLIRVLSEETYGLVTYVKSCMTYMHLIIDFGFLLSSVKDIVNAEGDEKRIGEIAGNTFGAKIILALIAGVVMALMCVFIPILQLNIAFVVLSFAAVAVTVFFADFLFRGIEKMQYITAVYVISKIVSTVLTFVVVRSDSDLLLIPVLDIVSNVLAVLISFGIIKRLKITIRITSIKDCWRMLKESFVYFLSSAATTAFTALNTVVIGIYLKDLTQIAHWGLCLNIVLAIQGLYAPICNGVYPHMIKTRSLKFIHKTMLVIMPVVIAGCVLSFVIADQVLLIIGGEKYVSATFLFRCMIPILFFSFPAQLYGWPTLGALGKERLTTLSTIIASVAQIVGIGVLIVCNRMTVINLAILRGATECLFMMVRVCFVYRSKVIV